jgi:predicted Rossmann fold flavoprotein
MKRTVCIVGGGASGIMAAIAAAQAGAQVTLLEHQDRIGKKILLTGNGKCNLTNLQMDAFAYGISAEDSFVHRILRQFDQNDLMKLLGDLGMRLTLNRDSYVYPETEAAATVINVYRRALEYYDVCVRTQVHVTDIKREQAADKQGFVLDTSQGKIRADRVILACGGKSFPKTGSDGSGFALAKKLGLQMAPDYPALTALICQKDGQKTIAGLREEGKVTLYIDECPAASDMGQIQFTDYGISGIPVFQISAPASKALLDKKQVRAEINLFPKLTVQEVQEAVQKQLQQFSQFSFEDAMAGFLHKKWIDYFGKQLGLTRFERAACIPQKSMELLVRQLTALSFPVKQVKGYEFCQVTGGGVLVEQIDEQLQAVRLPGLYIVGEMLDVVGKCGGYNLQWAFSTGYIAGGHAAQ